jgi:anti-anti-sigma factor
MKGAGTVDTITCDWELDVERGPDCLLVKVGKPQVDQREMPPLGDAVQSLLEVNLTYRLVLELDQIDSLSSDLIGQLLSLDKWIRVHHGMMRLCGLSPHNLEVLRRCCLDSYLPVYQDRLEAVLGWERP